MGRESLIKEQDKIAKKLNVSMFAPESGYCYNCKKDIVDEDWGKKLITGCKYCYRSYCD